MDLSSFTPDTCSMTLLTISPPIFSTLLLFHIFSGPNILFSNILVQVFPHSYKKVKYKAFNRDTKKEKRLVKARRSFRLRHDEVR
jgi:hypothetical protein